MQQAEGFQYGYVSFLVNEMGQSSGGNTANLIKIPNLDDPTVIEKIRRESIEQSESMRLNESLSSLKSD